MSVFAKENITENSHYVPVFLLDRWKTSWKGADELVRGYSWRREAQRLIHRDKGAKGFCSTKFYYLPSTAPLKRDIVEIKILTPVDNSAAPIIEDIRQSAEGVQLRQSFVRSFGLLTMTDKARIVISKFILSLLARNPYEVYDLVFKRTEEHRNLLENNEHLKVYLIVMDFKRVSMISQFASDSRLKFWHCSEHMRRSRTKNLALK